MAEILDTDILLINREGKSYKVTGAEVKTYLGATRAARIEQTKENLKTKKKKK